MAPFRPIISMFSQSPLKALQAHMQKVFECAQLLLPFFHAVIRSDWPQVEQLQQNIVALEEAADQIKKNIRLHMPKDLFLPVPRSDLLEMLILQDRIANKAKDIAGLVLGRRMVLPKQISHLFIDFLQRCLDAAQQANKVINELEELLETGFRGAEVAVAAAMVVELDRIEAITDDLQVDIRRMLFSLEKTLPPIEIMFLYKIVEWVGDLADHAHSVGGQLELLLAH